MLSKIAYFWAFFVVFLIFLVFPLILGPSIIHGWKALENEDFDATFLKSLGGTSKCTDFCDGSVTYS